VPLESSAIGYQPKPPQPPQITGDSLEQKIGLKWAGWVGAVVLMIATGLGIKFAYDNGWFGTIPVGLKLLLMWAGSAGLIGLGEWVFRRVNKLSAAGLFGAGVACMFLVSYSGHAFLDAYEPKTAFILMAGAALVGAAVAMRAGMVSIAILALIGGNLAPMLLGSRGESQVPFLGYLLLLQVTALVLAWRGGSARWWTLRGFSLVTTGLWTLTTLAPGMWGSGWIDPRSGPVLFVILFAALYQLELLLSARGRNGSERVGVVFSAIVTAMFSAAMLLVYRDSGRITSGAVVTAIAVACATLAWICATRRGGVANAWSTLSGGYWIQSIALLVIAVPVSFTGWAVVAGWAALAVTFTGLGVRTNRADHRLLGAATWALSIGYFIVRVDQHWKELRAAYAFTLGETGIPQFVIVAAALVLTGHLVAWLMLRRKNDLGRSTESLTTVAGAVMVSSGVFWVATSITGLPAIAASIAILGYAWLCAGWESLAPRMNWVWHSAGGLAVVAVKWTLIDIVAQRLSASTTPIILNPAMALGCAIALSMIAIWWLKRRRLAQALQSDSTQSGALPMAVGVIAMMTVGLSIEAERAVAVAATERVLTFPKSQTIMLVWTMLWTASSAALIGALRLLRRDTLSIAIGTLLALVLAAKLLVLDFLSFRLANGVAGASTVGLNLQTLACLGLLGHLALSYWLNRTPERQNRAAARMLAVVAVAMGWFLVSMEIDRWAASQSPSWIMRQVGFSIWWSLYAVILIISGFRLRVAALRYAGLALFAVTLGKVVLIDLSTAAKGMRILSFLGLGVLLLSTSVLYGKFSPKPLAGQPGEENQG